jgi:type II secretory pathway pseudopilin PulG
MQVGTTPWIGIAPKGGTCRGQFGYSLVQLLVAIAVLGVLGGFAVSKWNQFNRMQTLLGEGKALLIFLEEARSYGLKKNKQVGVQFTASGTAYQLFEDKNSSGSMDLGESVRTVQLHRNVSFGMPANPPTSGPQGESLPANGLSGAWIQGWIAPLDLSQSPSIGMACLKQNQLEGYTLCLFGQATTHKGAASLWDGKAWISL